MADLLGATNPVPGYDNSTINRNLPASPDNTQIQNVPDPTRVVGPDGRTEQQDSGMLDSGQIRYDSNFQTFLQQLKESGDLPTVLSRLFLGERTVVSSGLSEGAAAELSQALEMLKMDESQLLDFMTGQCKEGTRFGGPLFALLRNAYAKADSGVRLDILNFAKSYVDYSSTTHLEGNILRNLQWMSDSIPGSWSEKLTDILAQLENGVSAGDREGNLTLLRQKVFPFMSEYVNRTHDLGTARGRLTMLSLDMARYENGSVGKLLESFRKLSSYGTLKDILGKIDDKSLLALLRESEFSKDTAASRFAGHLAAAAGKAIRGDGNAETQEIFKQLVNAMLINESVYMPLNHFLFPLQLDDRMLFSEMWVDPDSQEENGSGANGQRGNSLRFLLKLDVQSLGLFDIILNAKEQEVDVRIACPEKVAPFSKEIEQAVSQILTRNGLTPVGVAVRKMERPVTLTEVFPKIFEGKDSINVKV